MAKKKYSKTQLIRLLRDCVSETWGNWSFDKTQELFDKFLRKRGLLKDIFGFVEGQLTVAKGTAVDAALSSSPHNETAPEKYVCANCGQPTTLHEPPLFKCPKPPAPCRVKITKCSFAGGWYKDLIGEEFDVDLAFPPKDYILWEDYTNPNKKAVWRHIAQQDCYRVTEKGKVLAEIQTSQVPTDCEIIAIRDADGSISHSRNMINFWKAKLDRGTVSIHSLRRLKDNELFIVGEETLHGEITEFVITDLGMYARIKGRDGGIHLSALHKRDKSIFNHINS